MALRSSAGLTVDLGNSRAKFRLWHAAKPELVEAFDIDLDAGFLSAAETWLTGIKPEFCTAMCAVAELDLEHRLAALLRDTSRAGFLADPEHGLELAVDSPETIGRDRLFAARGAIEKTGRSAIVVDCGTALTVDLVIVPVGRDASAIFAGGAIAPGPRLLANALATGGARLPEVQASPSAPALGKHTHAALEAGVAVGLRGAARELVNGLKREAGDPSLPVVLTGGARHFLTSGDPLADELLEEPELIHLGLLAALERVGGAQ